MFVYSGDHHLQTKVIPGDPVLGIKNKALKEHLLFLVKFVHSADTPPSPQYFVLNAFHAEVLIQIFEDIGDFPKPVFTFSFLPSIPHKVGFMNCPGN